MDLMAHRVKCWKLIETQESRALTEIPVLIPATGVKGGMAPEGAMAGPEVFQDRAAAVAVVPVALFSCAGPWWRRPGR